MGCEFVCVSLSWEDSLEDRSWSAINESAVVEADETRLIEERMSTSRPMSVARSSLSFSSCSRLNRHSCLVSSTGMYPKDTTAFCNLFTNETTAVNADWMACSVDDADSRAVRKLFGKSDVG